MTEIDIVTTTFVLPQKNSWHIVYILLTLKPMIQLPKKPKNSLMKNDMECKFKNRLSSRCNVQNSIQIGRVLSGKQGLLFINTLNKSYGK